MASVKRPETRRERGPRDKVKSTYKAAIVLKAMLPKMHASSKNQTGRDTNEKKTYY